MNTVEYIKKLKKFEPIYVIGHSNIDIDSAISSKILSEIFNFFNIKSYYAILDKKYRFDKYNKKMLDACSNFEPKIITFNDITKHNYFLVDHNDFLQSVGKGVNVVGCIDHHPNSKKIKNAIITDCCATSLYLYELFKNIYKFTDEQKKQIFMAFLNDSTFGKSSRYKQSDKKLIEELGFSTDYEELFQKYFIPTDLTNGITDAIYNGHKKYQFGNTYFESGYIETFGTDGLKEYEKTVKNLKNFLGIWIDYEELITYVFFSYNDTFKKWKYNFLASRATTILNDVLLIVN